MILTSKDMILFFIIFWVIVYIAVGVYFIVHKKNKVLSLAMRSAVSGIICIFLLISIAVLTIEKEDIYIYIIFLTLMFFNTIWDTKDTLKLIKKEKKEK